MTPRLDDCVLIVVDAQYGFLSAASAPAVPVIADILAQWQAAGGASILTQFVNEPDSNYVKLIGWAAMMDGGKDIDLIREIAALAPTATAVVRKGTYSALIPEILDLIQRNGWHNIYVAGLDTESCVLATALGAFELGYTPWLLTDASASHAGQHIHEAGLLVAARYLGSGQLITTDEVPTEVHTLTSSR